jgi:hypothetical protein
MDKSYLRLQMFRSLVPTTALVNAPEHEKPLQRAECDFDSTAALGVGRGTAHAARGAWLRG